MIEYRWWWFKSQTIVSYIDDCRRKQANVDDSWTMLRWRQLDDNNWTILLVSWFDLIKHSIETMKHDEPMIVSHTMMMIYFMEEEEASSSPDLYSNSLKAQLL